jgi:nucleotidyltransferase substrate binding protein (TIGR01987 family)
MSASRSAQAFTKFTDSLARLERALALPSENEDFRNSAILTFLLAQECCWKALKWVLKDKIGIEVGGPKPVLQEAYVQGWLGEDDTPWLAMADDRNLVTHTYNAEQALSIYSRLGVYSVALRHANDTLLELYPDLQAQPNS